MALDSVAVVITNVFQKKNVNKCFKKFVRIMKIFTKINDLKNHGAKGLPVISLGVLRGKVKKRIQKRKEREDCGP